MPPAAVEDALLDGIDRRLGLVDRRSEIIVLFLEPGTRTQGAESKTKKHKAPKVPDECE
jgi:hypothetical protein